MRTWQLQEAKNKFSEVVQRAGTEGPQAITVRGEEKAVVISIEEYRKLKPRPTLLEVLRDPRVVGVELDLSRPDDYERPNPFLEEDEE